MEKGFGVCRLPVIPVMKDPKWDAELSDELLFGEPYCVINSKGAWLQVTCPDMQLCGASDGWIAGSQHHRIEEDYYRQLTRSEFRIVTDIHASLLFRKTALVVPVGSIVPVSAGELFKVEEQLAFNGEAHNPAQRRDADFLVQTARHFLNFPERRGGRTPFGMDPESWVRMCFRICGVSVSARRSGVALLGKPLEGEGPVPGDLVLLQHGSEVRPGIVIDSGKVIVMDGYIRMLPVEGNTGQSEEQGSRRWQVTGYRRVMS